MSTTENENIKIGLVIMASGLGKRFGGNKLMEVLEDRPLVRWILDSTDSLFDKRIVVTRNKDVKMLCDNLNIDCIIHDFPNRNDTVRLGLSVLLNDVDYCFFAPGDQPLIGRETLSRLIEEAKENKDKIIRLSFRDTIGTPTGFPEKFFVELLNLPEGKGGNYIANNNKNLVYTVEADNEYELWDVDTVSDMDAIKNKRRFIT
ncbi:MAG: nucleotidyltransferase family protein [Lachnospiraceae bacterium]|nr:nucleotidyltransferase family protein [Lachnospiraceae bacterium]